MSNIVYPTFCKSQEEKKIFLFFCRTMMAKLQSSPGDTVCGCASAENCRQIAAGRNEDDRQIRQTAKKLEYSPLKSVVR